MSEPFGGHRILLIEADRGLSRALAAALSEAGFSVFAERDGDWALRTFQARPIDLAVIDVLLAGRPGTEVAEELRRSEKGRNLPIVMTSGVVKASKGLRELQAKLGGKAPLEWMEKPFAPSRLVATLQRMLKVAPEETDPEARRKRRERARIEARAKDLSSIEDLQEAKGVESESQVRLKGSALVRGNLRDTPFAEVLSQLHRWRATGALLVQNEPVKKIVYLKEGAPLFVRSNLLSECLGRILVRERMITVAECDESLRRLREEKRQQGALLIEMKCISPANLGYALQLQQESKLFDLFTWPEGEYSFNPLAQTPRSLVAIESTSAHLFHEAIAETYDAARVRTALGEVDSMSVRLTDDPLDRFQDMGLQAESASLLSRIDGRRTVAELLGHAQREGLHPNEALATLYALKCANMIKFGLPQPQKADTIPPPLPAAAPRGAGISELPVALDVPPPPIAELPSRALPEPELVVRQQLERLAARAQDLRRGSLYEALGVPRDASEFEIRQAFALGAKEAHPDHVGLEASREARALADEIFQHLVHAHEVLSDRVRRAAYETELRQTPVQSDGDEAERILAAEERFHEGERLLSSRAFVRAKEAFAEAVRLYPDEAEFHACLGWAQWSAELPSEDSATRANALIERALELNPRMDRAYVFRGLIQKALGHASEAGADFEKALTCNPACAEALIELQLTRN